MSSFRSLDLNTNLKKRYLEQQQELDLFVKTINQNNSTAIIQNKLIDGNLNSKISSISSIFMIYLKLKKDLGKEILQLYT
jgi:hypothetical protein